MKAFFEVQETGNTRFLHTFSKHLKNIEDSAFAWGVVAVDEP